MNRNELYLALYNGFVMAFPEKTKQQCQSEAVSFWNLWKVHDHSVLEENVTKKIKELDGCAMRKKGRLLQFWGKSLKDAENSSKSSFGPGTSGPPTSGQQPTVSVPNAEENQTEEPLPSTSGSFKRPAPVQDRIKDEINDLNSQIMFLSERKSSDLTTDDENRKLWEMKNKKQQLEKNLKAKIGEQDRQQKYRAKAKEAKQRLLEEIPDAGKYLKIQAAPGRPRIEDVQTDLLKTICDIALYGSAAQEKRHDESIRSIKTLDELTAALNVKGFSISRTATYLRLLPRRGNSIEGKRHVKTVPVKLMRSSNSKHHDHQDGKFCKATIGSLEEVASVLGPDEVAFLSQDDKAPVVIGLTAATKQAPILMHVEYKVTLPDHDWVVANKHKLIPSVYAGIAIKRNGLGNPDAVGYSGPTYVAIRSGKHASSTAFSHAIDINRLMEIEAFDEILKFGGFVKPVMIVIVDGGPDENPRYKKVIETAIHHFKQFNLDAMFIATNAPGRSAFNRVERRMAPLSKELAGLIIPHDHFGSHFDSQLRTTDIELEKKNFKYAGETLASVWNQLVVDDYPTVAEYVDPEASEIDPDLFQEYDTRWFADHVRTSQYMLQIVKCSDLQCCSPMRSSLSYVLPNKFLPPPISITQTSEGLKGSARDEVQHFPSMFLLNSFDMSKLLPKSFSGFKVIPYDLYCPSLKDCLKDRVCPNCGLYFATQLMLREHKKMHKSKDLAIRKIRPVRVAAKRQKEWLAIFLRNESTECEWIDENELDLGGVRTEHLDVSDESEFPVVKTNMHLQNPWEVE